MNRRIVVGRLLGAGWALLLAFPGFAINASVAQIDSSRLLLAQQVGVYASVTDAEGNPLPNLRQIDFSIQESADGERFEARTITSFTPNAGGTQGIAFLLLIDNSGSMYDTVAGKPTADPALMRITAAREAVRTFLASMTNPDDRIGLVDFNTLYHQLSRPTAERERITELLDGIARPAPDQAYTELYAAITSASREFSGVGGRKAIIVLSDGENYPYAVHSGREHPVTGTRVVAHTEAILACQREGVTVYGIGFGPEKDRNLQAITVETGGRLFDAADAGELSSAYQTIRRQVAGEYLLTYRAGLAPAERTHVRVAVDAAGARASATRFYFASTVLGLPMTRLTVLLLVPFAVAILLLAGLTLLKLERRRGPASLEVLQTVVGRPSTRMLPLGGSKTVIGAARAADLTIAGAPQVQSEHATILFDPKDRRYTVVGKGEIRVNNQPVSSRKLESGDVIDVGGATIVFDQPKEEKGKAAKRRVKKG